ncbi:MAG: MFS transporter, partial [Pirellulaceae bacterium]
LVRLPPEGWQPSSLAARSDRRARGKVQPVHADQALRTPQFYLLWSMLFINVTAGIGILGKASDMLQDMFPTTVATGSWFVGLLSMANMLGRILWSSASDYLGRRRTYAIFFGLGATLYATLPHFSQTESPWLFMLTCGLIMTMYGGAFATIPAYLRDLFGTMHVGAIHGRLLTAWSLAGVAGPVLLTRWAEHHKQMGGPASESYRGVLLFMAGLLLLGLAANAALYPVSSCHHYREVD